ncbi:hypothetical protein VTN96DRAFT_9279 [Rasamsonia emersonii]
MVLGRNTKSGNKHADYDPAPGAHSPDQFWGNVSIRECFLFLSSEIKNGQHTADNKDGLFRGQNFTRPLNNQSFGVVCVQLSPQQS